MSGKKYLSHEEMVKLVGQPTVEGPLELKAKPISVDPFEISSKNAEEKIENAIEVLKLLNAQANEFLQKGDFQAYQNNLTLQNKVTNSIAPLYEALHPEEFAEKKEVGRKNWLANILKAAEPDTNRGIPPRH